MKPITRFLWLFSFLFCLCGSEYILASDLASATTACTGQVKSWHRCVGEEVSANGEVYVGNWDNGLKSGKGAIGWPDGSIYIGGTKDGVPHGFGRYEFKGGNQFVGTFRNGLRIGIGIDRGPDGAVIFSGNFEDGMRRGESQPTNSVDETRLIKDPQLQAWKDRLMFLVSAGRRPEVGKTENTNRLQATTRPPSQIPALTFQSDNEKEKSGTELLRIRKLEDQIKQHEEERQKNLEKEKLFLAEIQNLQEQKRKQEMAIESLQKQLAEGMSAARNNAQQSSKHALVIGIDQYQNIPKLRNAIADAREVATTLRDFGFKVRQYSDLNERVFKQAIRDFMASISPGDEVVIFYAGHGIQIGGVNYFLPADTRGDSERQVRDEAIQLQRILDDLSEVKPSFGLIIVDACRDNPFKGQGRNIGGRGLSPTSAATGQMIIFSAGVNQQALDALGPTDKVPNSVFTRVLIAELKRPNISIDRMARNVRTEVVRLAKSVGHEQVPALYDQSIGEFYLNRK